MSINPSTKACIAYIAGRLVSGRDSSAVYDYSQGRYINVAGSVTGSAVSIYDYSRSCHISGGGAPQISLYDYGGSHHITLTIDGTGFSGYDYGSSTHFSGTVNGTAVSVYDYGGAGYTNYSI